MGLSLFLVLVIFCYARALDPSRRDIRKYFKPKRRNNMAHGIVLFSAGLLALILVSAYTSFKR